MGILAVFVVLALISVLTILGYDHLRGVRISFPDEFTGQTKLFSRTVTNDWPLGDPSAREFVAFYGTPDTLDSGPNHFDVEIVAQRLPESPRAIMTALGAGIGALPQGGTGLVPTHTTVVDGTSYTCVSYPAASACLWIDDSTTALIGTERGIGLGPMLSLAETFHRAVRG